MAKKGRDKAGRFAKGNPGGPGRPPRPIERQYLETISDLVPLSEWQAIVRRAVDDAKNGDAKAREWLSKHVVGDSSLTLTQLAMREKLGVSAEAEFEYQLEKATRVIHHDPDPLVKALNPDQGPWDEKPPLLLMAEFANGNETGSRK